VRPLTPLVRWDDDELVLDFVNAWHVDDVGDEPT
jgi:hypothetical protein